MFDGVVSIQASRVLSSSKYSKVRFSTLCGNPCIKHTFFLGMTIKRSKLKYEGNIARVYGITQDNHTRILKRGRK